MVNDHAFDLMQRDLDGETSSDERAELQTILAADAEVREAYDSLRDVVRHVEAIGPVAPPATFAHDVMKELRARSRAVASPVSDFASRRRRILQLSYAVAAGLLLGLVLAPWLFRIDLAGEMSATDASASMAAASVESWRVVEKTSARVESGVASLTVRSKGHRVAVQPDLDLTAPGVVEMTWDPERLAVLGFARAEGKATLSLESGRLRLESVQDDTVTLIFTSRGDGAPRMPVALSVNGARVLSVALKVDGIR